MFDFKNKFQLTENINYNNLFFLIYFFKTNRLNHKKLKIEINRIIISDPLYCEVSLLYFL